MDEVCYVGVAHSELHALIAAGEKADFGAFGEVVGGLAVAILAKVDKAYAGAAEPRATDCKFLVVDGFSIVRAYRRPCVGRSMRVVGAVVRVLVMDYWLMVAVEVDN